MTIALIILLILIILFIILNILYKRTNEYKNRIDNIKKFIEGVPNELEIINIGSSYSKYAYDYSEFSINGFNLAIQPESLSYDFKILKQYSKNLKEGCIVLINIPNLVFSFIDYKNDFSNIKYYHFLDKKYINNYSKLKYLINISLPLLRHPRLVRFIFKDIEKKNLNLTKNTNTNEQIKSEIHSRVLDWQNECNKEDLISNDVKPEIRKNFESNIEILKNMINYCFKNRFRPIIVIPPISKKLNECLSQEFLQTYLYDNINKANERNIPVFNYMKDIEFENIQLYLNIDFLNKRGRKKFTEKILHKLEEIGYIEIKEIGKKSGTS